MYVCTCSYIIHTCMSPRRIEGQAPGVGGGRASCSHSQIGQIWPRLTIPSKLSHGQSLSKYGSII
jgi:hypothetical protein